MATDDGYKMTQEFLSKMDTGEFGDKLVEELGRLTSEQREILAKILMDRAMDRHHFN